MLLSFVSTATRAVARNSSRSCLINNGVGGGNFYSSVILGACNSVDRRGAAGVVMSMSTEAATKSDYTTPPVDAGISSAASSSVSTPETRAAGAAPVTGKASSPAQAKAPTSSGSLVSMPNLKNYEMQSLGSVEEEEMYNEKLEDLILPSAAFEPFFPEVVDIPGM